MRKLTKQYLRSIGTLKGKKFLDEDEIKQILENQEKAEKFDECFYGEKIDEIEQENKQLKQKLEKIEEVSREQGDITYSRLKEILESKE